MGVTGATARGWRTLGVRGADEGGVEDVIAPSVFDVVDAANEGFF